MERNSYTVPHLTWPSNYSLLLLWHMNGSLHQTEARLRKQLSHSHMFAEWTVHLDRFAERVLFQQPAVYIAEHALQTNLRERNLPDRRVRRRVPPEDLDEHRRALRALHQRATAQEAVNPVSFGLTNEWYDTIIADKKTPSGTFHERYDMIPKLNPLVSHCPSCVHPLSPSSSLFSVSLRIFTH